MRPLRLVMTMLLALSLPSIGCGDSGSGTTETSTTLTSSTSEPGTSTTVTTGASTDPTTTGATTEPTETTTGASATSGTTTTGVTTIEVTTGETVSTGATEPGTSSTSTTGETTTGGGEVLPCVTDADCTLSSDCCTCEAQNPGETVPECDLPECLQTHCSAIGIEETALECRFGVCVFQKQTCNPFGITCNATPPDCGADSLPTVEDTNEGKCWTGNCVPAETCDWVPGCEYCDDPELVCVAKLQKGAYQVCEPKPFDCPEGDDIDCGCGQQVCDGSAPHTVCIDTQDDIACECPFC